MEEGSIADQVGPDSDITFAVILLGTTKLRHRPILIMELRLEAASWSSLDGSSSWPLILLAIAVSRRRIIIFD